MSDTTLLEDVSPNGNVQAIVECDGRTLYLYLRGSEGTGLGIRATWVRNLVPAPPIFESEATRDGRAPLLPRGYCTHPDGAELPDHRNLRLVWLEEGDAAALLLNGQVIAAIPSWAGGDFPGYAADCRGRCALAWALPSDSSPESILPRIERAKAWWADWDSARVWKPFQTQALAHIEGDLGPVESYFGTDEGKWPPAFLARVERPEGTWLLTGGMSLRPQPRVEQHLRDPRPQRRIELAVAVAREHAEHVETFMSWCVGFSRLPWQRYTWLGHGHSLVAEPMQLVPDGTVFPGMLLIADPADGGTSALPLFRDDPVTRLFMVPITATEQQLIAEQGAQELMDRLAAAGVGALVRERASVV